MNALAEKLAQAKGKAPTFLRGIMGYTGDDCIFWPFPLNPVNGYGLVALERTPYLVHRVMCEVTHGPAPSRSYYATHSCHNRACVNPRHLNWRTHSQNMLDKRENGTVNNAWWGKNGKLTAAEASAILALKGHATQDAIAKAFGITESNVRKIQTGQTWAARIAEFRAVRFVGVTEIA